MHRDTHWPRGGATVCEWARSELSRTSASRARGSCGPGSWPSPRSLGSPTRGNFDVSGGPAGAVGASRSGSASCRPRACRRRAARTSAEMIAGRYHPNLKPSPPLAGCLTCHWSGSERPAHWHWQVRYHWQVRSESESLAGILLGQDLRVRYYFTILLGQDMRVRYITRPGGQVYYSAGQDLNLVVATLPRGSNGWMRMATTTSPQSCLRSRRRHDWGVEDTTGAKAGPRCLHSGSK